jgi:sterol desaturase/sphingolipid hydroxylase (fatty acid hydroxylase superfamily)
MLEIYYEAVYQYARPHVVNSLYAMKLSLWLLVPLLILEAWTPAKRLHWPTVMFNLAYAPFFMALAGMAISPISTYVHPHMPANLFGGNPLVWPWWMAALIALGYLAAFDFCYYWLHRAQHTWSFMWRYHHFHHADVNVSTSTSFRHHWLEESFRYFVVVVPTFFLFANPSPAVPWLGLFMGGYGLFIHWNTRLNLGPLSGVVVGPLYHRLHHSVQPEHINKNFAIFFPFWDRLFGTQCLPDPTNLMTTGIEGLKNPNSVRQLLPIPWLRK